MHPRPDERHIRYSDVRELKKVVTTEFNIEGDPDDRYLQIIEEVKPAQATLVPDKPESADTAKPRHLDPGVIDNPSEALACAMRLSPRFGRGFRLRRWGSQAAWKSRG